ncbi:MAG: alpha/beta hydrolase [Lachnospiraceae bacterium]|nr:alpha/beta hydrolase [Lachnospiraceae bacterium]
MSKISEEVRMNFKKVDDIRDEGLTTPDDVVRYDDILYGTDKTWQVMDVYRPKDKEGEKLPVIVSFHGGGWVYGDKERYQFYCMSLAEQGFAVVNFTYGLAPDFKFPSQLNDANLVFTWVIDHAGEYGFDTDNVFAVGDSAGAHQLGLYCNICTNPEYAKKANITPPKGFAPRAVALNCGVYRVVVNRENVNLDTALMGEYLPNGGTDEEINLVSVADHMTKDFPPTFYMTCTGDFLIAQAPILEEKLLELQIDHEFRFVTGEKELGHVFHCNMKSDDAHKLNREECFFFKNHIK